MIIERAMINRRARRRVNKYGDVWRVYVCLASSVEKGASPTDDKTDDRLKNLRTIHMKLKTKIM